MKKFTITIYSNDSWKLLETVIQLFLKQIRMRGLSTKASYEIEEVSP